MFGIYAFAIFKIQDIKQEKDSQHRGTQREKYRKTLQMQFSTFSYRFMVF